MDVRYRQVVVVMMMMMMMLMVDGNYQGLRPMALIPKKVEIGFTCEGGWRRRKLFYFTTTTTTTITTTTTTTTTIRKLDMLYSTGLVILLTRYTSTSTYCGDDGSITRGDGGGGNGTTSNTTITTVSYFHHLAWARAWYSYGHELTPDNYYQHHYDTPT